MLNQCLGNEMLQGTVWVKIWFDLIILLMEFCTVVENISIFIIIFKNKFVFRAKMDRQSVVTNSLDGITAPGTREDSLSSWVSLESSLLLYHIWGVMRIATEQTMLRSQLTHTGLPCPTHCTEEVRTWNTTERLKGIVTGANISVHKKWKKCLWRVKGAGKEQVLNFWEDSGK